MIELTLFAACAAFFVFGTAPTIAESGSAEHHHGMEGFSAGEPGDPNLPSRIIQVTMEERDGKMLFVPDRLEIRKGEQIQFVLHNSGELEHEFVLGTAHENLEHAEMMKENPEMQHSDPNARTVQPKQASEILWKFTKAGEFEYACLIPGHHEAGMIGILEVK